MLVSTDDEQTADHGPEALIEEARQRQRQRARRRNTVVGVAALLGTVGLGVTHVVHGGSGGAQAEPQVLALHQDASSGLLVFSRLDDAGTSHTVARFRGALFGGPDW
jgi:hypothetical protein